MMGFFDSYAGRYVVQSIVHSVVALVVVEMSLRIWQVTGPRERFRYRLLVIILPFLLFPLFQLINPDRSSFYFVEDTAIFSAVRWLKVDLFGAVPLAVPFALIVLGVSAMAFVQEVAPIARDMFGGDRSAGGPVGTAAAPEVANMVKEMSGKLGIEEPRVVVITSDAPVIFTTGTKIHSIVLSSQLLKVFDCDQVRSALAHELAHIVRRSNFTTLLVFLVRICMFYNPVSLLEFRRLVQDDEHICDEITVSITGDRFALASALRAFWIRVPRRQDVKVTDITEVIGNSSHNLLLKERITRLEDNEDFDPRPHRWGGYVLTVVAVIGLSYFIV